MTFKVKFRGTRGSYPTPKATHLKYGGNTSCVEVNVRDQLIILDAGTGIIELGENLTREHILSGGSTDERKPIRATLILSHIHIDHIQGLPFFSPEFIKTTKLEVYGPDLGKENLKDTISTLLYDKSFPVSLEEIQGAININSFSQRLVLVIKENGEHVIYNLAEFKKENVNENDIVITAYKTTAHPKNGCLCIKISYKDKVLVYATDKECYVGSDKKFIDFAYGWGVWIHDAQYTHQDYISPIAPKQGYGHSTFDMAIDAMNQTKAKNLVFFHYDPGYDDKKLDKIKEFYESK